MRNGVLRATARARHRARSSRGISTLSTRSVGWAARRGPVSIDMGLFRAASLQTQRARFPGTELSSDLCRVRDGVRVDPVMARGADDECLAPHFRHEGGPRGLARSRFPEFPEAGDLVD